MSSVTVCPVVVDNGGLEGYDHPVLSAAAILKTESNLGYAGAANVALRHWLGSLDLGDKCVIGSHDLLVEPSALEFLIDTMDNRPEIGILGPVIERPMRMFGGVWSGHYAYHLGEVWSDAPFSASDWVSGTCLMLRRQCAIEVGFFDERFSSYVEDVDYCLRAADLGWKVGVDSRASVKGIGSSSPDAGLLVEANGIALARKRAGFSGWLKAMLRIGGLLVRSGVGGVAWWRNPSRRRASRGFAKLHALALLSGFRSLIRFRTEE